MIDEYSRDNWASGGELHSLKFGEVIAAREPDGIKSHLYLFE